MPQQHGEAPSSGRDAQIAAAVRVQAPVVMATVVTQNPMIMRSK